jgi:hypothetical protein
MEKKAESTGREARDELQKSSRKKLSQAGTGD